MPGGNAGADESAAMAPARVNRAPYFYAGHPDCLPSAELLDLQLISNGLVVAGSPPRIPIGAPVDIVLSLVPRVASSRNLWVRIGIGNEGSSVNYVFPVAASQWEIGSVTQQRCTVRIPPFTFVGHGVLSIAVQEHRAPASGADETTATKTRAPEAVIYQCRVEAPAVTTSSIVDEPRITSALGADVTRMKKAFRLAPGQCISLTLAPSIQRTTAGLAVISALRGEIQSRAKDTVLRITASAQLRAAENIVMAAGTSTLPAEYDAFRPGTRSLGQCERFDMYPYPGHTWKNEPLHAYAYLARLPLTVTKTPDQLTFENLSKTAVIDVYDVVLLHNPDSLRAPKDTR